MESSRTFWSTLEVSLPLNHLLQHPDNIWLYQRTLEDDVLIWFKHNYDNKLSFNNQLIAYILLAKDFFMGFYSICNILVFFPFTKISIFGCYHNLIFNVKAKGKNIFCIHYHCIFDMRLPLYLKLGHFSNEGIHGTFTLDNNLTKGCSLDEILVSRKTHVVSFANHLVICRIFLFYPQVGYSCQKDTKFLQNVLFCTRSTIWYKFNKSNVRISQNVSFQCDW